jgi:hypothetical protein
MKNECLFQIDRIKGNKIIGTYKIYANGDIDGFDNSDGSRYSIANYIPNYLGKMGISMSAAFPSIAVREESSPEI